ncbi:MAG: VCBS repeat-containing protein [Bryobacteraceae bacterium]
MLLEPKGETSASVSIGDVDGDGHLDIVLAKGRHWPLTNLLFRGDGKGQFKPESIGTAPDRTYSAALADLNGDGSLDLVVSNDRPDPKLVYLNDGKGHFRAAGSFGRPEWSTRYITLADVNGDRRPDILVANRSGGGKAGKPSFICLNDGKGSFLECNPLATESATIIVAMDLDGDGFVDLLVPHRDGGQNLIFWNDGSGTFAAKPSPVGPEHSNIRAAAAADLDGDGKPDIVVGDEQRGLFLYRNTGNRTFAAPVALGTKKNSPYSIAIADMNRDRKPDIVVGYQEAAGSVFFSDGKANAFHEISWNDGKGAVYGVAVGDLDGDGWPDIAAARSDAPNGIWFSGPLRK